MPEVSEVNYPKRILIHCTDSPNGKEYDISLIEKDHSARGFRTIGYHSVIQPSGELQKGRGFNEVGAHCPEANRDSIAICLVGADKFTGSQFAKLKYHLDSIVMLYPIQPHDIFCHNQFPSAIKQGKTCPNMLINDILGWYIQNDDRIIKKYIKEII